MAVSQHPRHPGDGAICCLLRLHLLLLLLPARAFLADIKAGRLTKEMHGQRNKMRFFLPSALRCSRLMSCLCRARQRQRKIKKREEKKRMSSFFPPLMLSRSAFRRLSFPSLLPKDICPPVACKRPRLGAQQGRPG